MKRKRLATLLTLFATTLGVLVSAVAFGSNHDSIMNKAEEIPYRIDLSYENKQLTKEIEYNYATFKVVNVYTYRGSKLKFLQYDVSYENEKVVLGNGAWFGTIAESNVYRSLIKGLTCIHFVNGSNLLVKYSWHDNSGNVYEEQPDSNGDVYFSGLMPSYFRVEPLNSSGASFSSCEIYFACLVSPTDEPQERTASNVVMKQSFCGADPGDLYRYIDPEHSLERAQVGNNYIFAEYNKTIEQSLDLHNLVMSFNFSSPIGGKTHYEGVRLDDPFVTDLNIWHENSEHTKVEYGEQTLHVSFTFKDFGHVTNHSFTVFGYYRSTSHFSVVSADNVRKQANETIPEENAVLIWSYISFIGWGSIDAFDQTASQEYVGCSMFYRTINFKDLQHLQLDEHPFTTVGEHELSFRLEEYYTLHASYYVYDEDNYLKTIVYNGFKKEIEPGFDFEGYFESGAASVDLMYYDGTFENIVIDENHVDLSKVNTYVEGLYPYFVTIKGKKYKQFVSVVLTDIGEDEYNVTYTTNPNNYENVYAWGFDYYAAFNQVYIKSITTSSMGYRAVCFMDLAHPDKNNFTRCGTYAVDSDHHQLVLFGQLWASRVSFYHQAGDGEREFKLNEHCEVETSYAVNKTLIPTEDSYMWNHYGETTDRFYIFNTENNEMKVTLNSLTIRTTFSYLNEEKTQISFNIPFISFDGSLVSINLRATINYSDNSIFIETPSELIHDD